jgi:hypothetical protein
MYVERRLSEIMMIVEIPGQPFRQLAGGVSRPLPSARMA